MGRPVVHWELMSKDPPVSTRRLYFGATYKDGAFIKQQSNDCHRAA
jgi:hypothetical protein